MRLAPETAATVRIIANEAAYYLRQSKQFKGIQGVPMQFIARARWQSYASAAKTVAKLNGRGPR